MLRYCSEFINQSMSLFQAKLAHRKNKYSTTAIDKAKNKTKTQNCTQKQQKNNNLSSKPEKKTMKSTATKATEHQQATASPGNAHKTETRGKHLNS